MHVRLRGRLSRGAPSLRSSIVVDEEEEAVGPAEAATGTPINLAAPKI